MDYASPAVELLGFCVLLLVLAGTVAASVIFLRQKGSGPWIMLGGSILLLLSVVPRGLEQFVNYYANHGYEPPEVSGILYYTFWDWLPQAAGMVFATGLLMTSLQRRGLTKRISELESILAAHEAAEKI